MSFSAKVVADSVNRAGNRITTMVVTFPRFILAEFNTHRMFSRNSASSRAIKFERMIEAIEANPVIPIAFQKHHTGMQGNEYLEGRDADRAKDAWLGGMKSAVASAMDLYYNCGATKQLANRKVECYGWHTVIVTSTEWENFFELRCPKYVATDGANKIHFRSRCDLINWLEQFPKVQEAVQGRTEAQWFESSESGAEIHMQKIAELMWDAYNESEPKKLEAGDWHIPFGDQITDEELRVQFGIEPNSEHEQPDVLKFKIKIATARCAQVSYTVVGEDGKPMDFKKLVALHDRLAKAGHWSPFEHCAECMQDESITPMRQHSYASWSGNFHGFLQYRKFFENENITKKNE